MDQGEEARARLEPKQRVDGVLLVESAMVSGLPVKGSPFGGGFGAWMHGRE